jgi:hypothetical protein
MSGGKRTTRGNKVILTSITPSSLLQPRLDLLVGHLLGFKVWPVQDPGGIQPPHRRGECHIIDRQVRREREQDDCKCSSASCDRVVDDRAARTHNGAKPFEMARRATSSTISPVARPWCLFLPDRPPREAVPTPRYTPWTRTLRVCPVIGQSGPKLELGRSEGFV